MASPVPKHILTDDEIAHVPAAYRAHVCDMGGAPPAERIAGRHPCKYAPGLASALVGLAGSWSLGDPMAGVGTLARETGLVVALNDLDARMSEYLEPLRLDGCEVTYVPATQIPWSREVCIFSPPYYPRTDRRRPAAHPPARGPVVGFRDTYGAVPHPAFIGNPEGAEGLRRYRAQMTEVYAHLRRVCGRMVVVTKNWTRLGVELRLDLDTILMCAEAGWQISERHGWRPPLSLWARHNQRRDTGVAIEDVLVFAPGRAFA